MRMQERTRLLAVLRDGILNGGISHGDAVVESPLADFTCRDLLAQEKRIFFQQTPLLMGLSADLPARATYCKRSVVPVRSASL